jgi:ectoine hydroxylase-related dioxygenase (phytanoyl-CoA dioxygenase family)
MATPEQITDFQRDGLLIIRAKDVWSDEELQAILKSTREVCEWPETPGKWMKYFETSTKDGSRILNRVENFLDYHDGFKCLEKLTSIATTLVGEEMILYKEKINFKLPGGDGFKPHQDHAAGWWRYDQTYHLSALVAIDHATLENGCLQVVRGEHKNGLLGPEYEEIPEEHVNRFTWEPVICEPGDVVYFDSYVPHKSEPNNSDKQRNALYLTYAKKAEGDYRERYYADKRISFPPDIERDPSKEYKYKI